MAHRLVQLDVEQLQGHVLQPVPLGVGPHELAHRARAVERVEGDAEVVAEDRDVEAREVEDLQDAGLLEQPLQAGGAGLRRAREELLTRDLDEHGPAGAVAELYAAQAVTQVPQAEGLGVDGQLRSCEVRLELFLGQVAADDLRRDLGWTLRHGPRL